MLTCTKINIIFPLIVLHKNTHVPVQHTFPYNSIGWKEPDNDSLRFHSDPIASTAGESVANMSWENEDLVTVFYVSLNRI